MEVNKMNDLNTRPFLGTGFAFPVEVDQVTGRFKVSCEEENIKQSIQLILMTNKGERVMRPEFGCDLKSYVYETMDFSTMHRMEQEVLRALKRWEPRITDINVNVSYADNFEGQVMISISYKSRVTNSPYNMVFPFYLQEGFV